MDMDDISKSHLENMLELYMTSIIITLSFQLSFTLYRKLKGIKDSNKDVDKKRTQVQNHQMAKSSTASSSQASKSGHKGPNPNPNPNPNPLMRLITRFTGTGNGTGYQELQFDEAEFECRQSGEQVSSKKPETAEAGCQVCQEIIQKRERRNRAHGGASGGNGSSDGGGEDVEAIESFTQDIFASEDTSAAAEPSEVKHTCAVCLDEDITLGSGNTTMTECGHVFHLTCLLKSLCQKNLCPMCRAPLEDVREKQMPANILTPVSAEQLISEEISYFPVASHTHSITQTSTPRDRVRRTKEMLRVFSFTLLRTVAEYVHETNMPDGWYDEGDDETESSEGDSENDNEDADGDNQDENQSNQSDQSEQSEEEQYDEDDEFNYAVRRVARIRDLRDSIGN